MSEGPTGTTPTPQDPGADGAPASPQQPVPDGGPAPRWGQYAPTPGPPAPTGWGAPADPRGRQQGPGQGQGPAGAPGQYGPPPTGQYGPPPTGQQAYGQYGQYGAPAPSGWGPSPWSPVPLAPRPGIIPLRPLSLGEIFDGAFRSIRTNPKVMFGLSAIVVSVTAILQAIVTWQIFATLEPAITVSGTGTADDIATLEAMFGDLVGQAGLVLGAQVISLAVTTILSGLLIVSVSRSVIGRTASPAEVWAAAKGRIWRLLGLTLVILLIVAAPVIIWAGLLIATLATEQWVLAAAVGVVGGIAMLVALLVLLTRTLLATPALMLERSGVVEALRRGWFLTHGTFWRVLGIYLLTSIIVAVVAGSITNGASLVLQLLAPDPTAVLTSPAYLAGTTLAQIVATTVTTPFSAAVTALLYIDVRMRTEGLDIELARAAEATD